MERCVLAIAPLLDPCPLPPLERANALGVESTTPTASNAIRETLPCMTVSRTLMSTRFVRVSMGDGQAVLTFVSVFMGTIERPRSHRLHKIARLG
jgi:hypothetical protein